MRSLIYLQLLFKREIQFYGLNLLLISDSN